VIGLLGLVADVADHSVDVRMHGQLIPFHVAGPLFLAGVAVIAGTRAVDKKFGSGRGGK